MNHQHQMAAANVYRTLSQFDRLFVALAMLKWSVRPRVRAF